MYKNAFGVLLIVATFALGVHGGRDGALAHAALARSDPPAGAVLPESPAEIRLWFTEPLETTFSGADLLDATGQPVPGVIAEISPEDPHLLVVTSPGLADGAYTVAWRTLSSADSHTLEGYFGFSVGHAVAAVLPEQGSEAADGRARELTRGFALVGLAALLAIAPIVLIVLDPAKRRAPALSATIEGPLRRYVVAAIVAALLGSVAALTAQAVAIAPELALPAALAATLAETRYGQMWLWREALLAAIAALIAGALWGNAARRRPLLGAAVVASLLAPIPFSLISHAAAQTEGRVAAIAADALHLLLASIWAGGLFMLALVGLPALRPLNGDERVDALRVALPRFSVVGIAAWGVLILSGLYSALLQVGSIVALRETAYGQALLLKLLLLLPVLVLAGWHYVLGRKAVGHKGARRFSRTIALETSIIVLVLLVAGRLIGLEPAREAMIGRVPAAIERQLAFVTDAGARGGRLVISPGAAGVNRFVISIAGAPLPETSEAVLRFVALGREIGEQELRLPAVRANHFEASGNELALTGDWRITAIVRQIGAFSWTAESVVSIGVEPPVAPAENPPLRFAPSGAGGMAIVALGIGLFAAAIGAHEASRRTRTRLAAASVVALVVGAAVLSAARVPPTVIAAIATEPAATTVLAPATPASRHVAQHSGHSPVATPPAERLAAAGTPVPTDGLLVTLLPLSAESRDGDLSVRVVDAQGQPLSGARVVVAWDMPGMERSREEAAANEVEPGLYQVSAATFTMPGEWQVSVRVSPKGKPSKVARFVTNVR